jgi:hypothetical protein
MVPANPVVFDDPRYAHCRSDAAAPRGDAGNWARCPDLPAAYPAFRPLVYSLDVMLPGVELQQQREWTPLASRSPSHDASASGGWATATRTLAWLQMLCGWAASFMLVAALLGLFNRDR